MPIRDPSFTVNYKKAHPEASPLEIFLWTNLANKPDYAYDIAYELEDWLASDRTGPVPDLVDYIAIYGYVRLRLNEWKLPVKLSPAEMLQWRKAGYFVELKDFQEALASVAGGFLGIAGTDPALIIKIIQQQLTAKLAELERLVDLPIDTTYTPEFMPNQIHEMLVKQGYKGAELEDMIDEYYHEDDHDVEVRRFELPFALRQQLQSFEWGMEKFRLLVMTETVPELNLPNRELFDALAQIDLNHLLAQLEKADAKLRRIWQNLAKYDCYDLNAEYEPESFWWRHWRKPVRKRGGKK